MNQKNTTTDNYFLNRTENQPLFHHHSKSQQCMNGSIDKSDNPLFGDEYLPQGQITTHPFNLTLKELSGLINYGQEKNKNTQAPQAFSSKDSSFSTEYSVEKNSIQSVGDSKSGGPTEVKTPKNTPIEDSSFSTEYSVEKSPNKPVGGSGWLHKYTKLIENKTGLVEYPRVKEGQRSPNNPKHWYWDYCWHKKGKNGKPLYKKGKAVVSSVGCPIKKVRAVERAIAAKLPHRQILEIIKGDNSPPT